MARFRCDSCDYVYDENAGDPREGFRHTVERGARRLGLPGLRCGEDRLRRELNGRPAGAHTDAARQTTVNAVVR